MKTQNRTIYNNDVTFPFPTFSSMSTRAVSTHSQHAIATLIAFFVKSRAGVQHRSCKRYWLNPKHNN